MGEGHSLTPKDIALLQHCCPCSHGIPLLCRGSKQDGNMQIYRQCNVLECVQQATLALGDVRAKRSREEVIAEVRTKGYHTLSHKCKCAVSPTDHLMNRSDRLGRGESSNGVRNEPVHHQHVLLERGAVAKRSRGKRKRFACQRQALTYIAQLAPQLLLKWREREKREQQVASAANPYAVFEEENGWGRREETIIIISPPPPKTTSPRLAHFKSHT